MRTIKSLFILEIAADLVIASCCLVYWSFDPGDRIHDLLFDRSPVQYVTLFTWALAMTLLGYRFLRYRRSFGAVRRLQKCQNRSELPDSSLSERIGKLRQLLAEGHVEAARTDVERFANEQQAEHQQVYEMINFLLCSLPALGLFGTMLGLSGALSAAFSGGKFGEDSIKMFVSSLGTALDTTVLALACALVAGSIAWLVNRMEKLLLAQQMSLLNSLSGIDRLGARVNAGRSGSSGKTGDPDIAATVRAEVQASMAESMTGITARFGECLAQLEDFARLREERAARSESETGPAPDMTTLAETVASCLDAAVTRIGDMIRAQNGEVVRTVASALNRFAEAMEASNVVDTVRAEVRSSMSEDMLEVNATLQKYLGKIEELVHTSLERGNRMEFETMPSFDQESFVGSITTCLDEAIGRIRELMAEQNHQGTQTVASALRDFSKATNARILQALITCNGEDDMELNHV